MEATCLSNCGTPSAVFSTLESYDYVTFTQMTANGLNPNVTFAANALTMNDPNGGTSTPCPPVGGNQFTVVYGTSSQCAVVPPPPPIANAASGLTAASFVANWTAPTEGNPATGYYLDVSTSNSFASFVTG